MTSRRTLTIDQTGKIKVPVQLVTETVNIFGRRGSGKTSTGVVFFEEMARAGQMVAVLDPLGVWYGLRSDTTGDGPGLPVTIFGGDYADIPLNAKAGAMVASLLVSERIPAVMDLSRLRSRSERRRFGGDFMTTLFEENRENRKPFHVIVDEADLFAPQMARGDEFVTVGAYQELVNRGRVYGLGCTSITQRPPKLNADIRAAASTLIVMELTGKHDVQAIGDWISANADPAQARELLASLASLKTGEGWIWSPAWLKLLARLQFRARTTFDSSRTPEIDEVWEPPRTFADLDPAALGKIRDYLNDNGEDGDHDHSRPAGADVRKLRAHVAELEAEVAQLRGREPETRDVPVLADEDRQMMAGLASQLTAITARWDARGTTPVTAPAREG